MQIERQQDENDHSSNKTKNSQFFFKANISKPNWQYKQDLIMIIYHL